METRTFPSAGVAHLVIEQAAGDAHVRGSRETTEISISYERQGDAGQEPFALDGDLLRFAGGPVTRVTVPAHVELTLEEASGDLRVDGLAAAATLGTVHGDLRLRDLSGPVTIGEADGDLRADQVADLAIRERCQGDLRAQAVGLLSAGGVAGDLRAYDSRGLRLGHVDGDLWAEKVAGPLAVDRAGGDAHVNEVEGPASLGRVEGDLRASALLRGLDAANVSGDAQLRGPFPAESSYNLAAHGDVALFLPADADVRASLQARGRIRSDLQLTPSPDGSATFTITVGRGQAYLSLSSGGDMRIVQAGGRAGAEGRAAGGDLDSLGDRIRRQVEAALPADLDNLGDRIRQQVQASLIAAGLDPETGHFGFERGPRGRWGKRPAGTPPGSQPPAPPGPPPERGPKSAAQQPAPSQSEQAAILKMLEEGTITAAEAEALLKALGA